MINLYKEVMFARKEGLHDLSSGWSGQQDLKVRRRQGPVKSVINAVDELEPHNSTCMVWK